MRVLEHVPRRVEFFTTNPRNSILVENCSERVLIRASRDNFSRRRKSCFLRELSAEGFIPDCFEHLIGSGFGETPGLRWTIDPSWTERDAARLVAADRFMIRLLVNSALLWGVLLGFGLLYFPR